MESLQQITGTSTTISGNSTETDAQDIPIPWLTAGTSYEVRVRATSDEGTGGWSPLGTGSTNVGNREPVFRDRTDETPVGTDATTTRELNENTQPGRPVGRPVVADDGDGDARSYKLVAATPGNDLSEAAATKFDINKSTGQILTKDPLNHEDEDCGYDPNADPTMCTYTVNVEVRDGFDENGNKEAEETSADDTIAGDDHSEGCDRDTVRADGDTDVPGGCHQTGSEMVRDQHGASNHHRRLAVQTRQRGLADRQL